MTIAPPAEAGTAGGTLTVLLVSSGRAGGDWAGAMRSPAVGAMGLRLVGTCDLDAGGEGDLARALEGRPDIVIDATSPLTRLAVAGLALRAGAHVLCEPPLGPDEETAAQLIGAAMRGAGRLAVAEAMRSSPEALRLRALAARAGHPLTLHAHLRIPVPSASRHAALRWAALPVFDAARAILGQDAAYAACIERDAGHGHGTHAEALFAMRGGAVFLFSARPARDGEPEGVIWRIDGIAPGADGTPAPEARDGRLGVLGRFAEAVRRGSAPDGQARDNAGSLAMVFAALRSAEAGGVREPVRSLAHSGDASAVPAPRRTAGGGQ